MGKKGGNKKNNQKKQQEDQEFDAMLKQLEVKTKEAGAVKAKEAAKKASQQPKGPATAQGEGKVDWKTRHEARRTEPTRQDQECNNTFEKRCRDLHLFALDPAVRNVVVQHLANRNLQPLFMEWGAGPCLSQADVVRLTFSSGAVQACLCLMALFDVAASIPTLPFTSLLTDNTMVSCRAVCTMAGEAFITQLLDNKDRLIQQDPQLALPLPDLECLTSFIAEKLPAALETQIGQPCPAAAVLWLLTIATTPASEDGSPDSTTKRLRARRDFVLRLQQRQKSVESLALDAALSKLNEATRGDFEHVKVVGGILGLDFAKNIPPEHLTKVLILGNSGRGKSWLINTMCGKQVFNHATQGAACTRDVTGVVVQIPRLSETDYYALYDVPGLIEADDEKVEENRKKICEAVAQFPESKTALILVFSGGNGGRVTAEDVECFNALKGYLGFDPSKVTVVVNNAPQTESEESDRKFRMNWFRFAARIVMTEKLIFVPHVLSHRTRNDYFAQQTLSVSRQMLWAAFEAVRNAQRATVNGDIKLMRHKLAEEKEERRKAQQARDDEVRRNNEERMRLLRKQSDSQAQLDAALASQAEDKAKFDKLQKAQGEQQTLLEQRLEESAKENRRLRNKLDESGCVLM